MLVYTPLWVLITLSIFAFIGFIIFCEFIYCLIKAFKDFFKQRKEFKSFAKSLKESGFLNEISKEMTEEEKEKLKATGKAGTKVKFDLKTKKVSVENLEDIEKDYRR